MNKTQKERIFNLLVTATEGGSNYWYMIQDANRNEIEGYKYYQELPLTEGGYWMVDDEQGEQTLEEPVRVDLKSLRKGYSIFKERYPTHYADIVNENDDATTGDVFFQCVVFGEVIYG